MEAPLQIGALGALTITFLGRRVEPLLSRKAGALLVYLAMTAQPHTREHLATLLWSDKTPERALGSLRMALLELRRQIAPAKAAKSSIRRTSSSISRRRAIPSTACPKAADPIQAELPQS